MANKIEIIVTAKDFTGKSFGLIGKRMTSLKRTVFNLKTAFIGLAGTVGLIAVGKSFITVGDKMEQYRLRLNAALRSTEKGAQVFKDMTKFAAKVPAEFDEIMEGATQLGGVLKGGVDEINQFMPIIADLAAFSGLKIQQVTQQVIRMYSAGAGSADLFRERGVLAMLGFQAGVSTGMEETRKKLIKEYEKIDSKFRGLSMELAKTWTGIMSMLADRWFLFRDAVNKAGLFDFIKAGASLVLKELDRLEKEGTLDQWAKDLSRNAIDTFEAMSLAVVGFADSVADVLSDIWVNIQMVWQGYQRLGLGNLGLIGAILLGPKGIAAVALFSWIIERFDVLGKQVDDMVVRARILKAAFSDVGLPENWAELTDKQKVAWLDAADAAEKLAEEVKEIDDLDFGNKLAPKVRKLFELWRKEAEEIGKSTRKAMSGEGEDGAPDITKALEKQLGSAALLWDEFFKHKENKIQEDLDSLKQAGVDATTIFRVELDAKRDLLREFGEAQIEHAITIGEGVVGALNVIAGEFESLATRVGDQMLSMYQSVTQGIGDAVAQAIVFGDSLGDALKGIFKDILASWISMLVKWIAQWAIQALVGIGITATTTAAKMAGAAALTYANTFASVMASVPYPFNVVVAPIAASAATGVMLAGSGTSGAIGKGVGAGIVGIGHDGIPNVPREGTYLLDKGERVLNKQEKRDFEGGGRGTFIKELNIMPFANIDQALFDKPMEWWNRLFMEKILPAQNEAGRNNATTTLRFRAVNG